MSGRRLSLSKLVTRGQHQVKHHLRECPLVIIVYHHTVDKVVPIRKTLLLLGKEISVCLEGIFNLDSSERICRYQNEVKFNSVDRVGNKRNVHTKPVNGGLHEDLYLTGSSKKALDSTRISADQLVQELLKTNKLDETTFQENTFTNDANGGGVLELFVGKDGSATISGRPSRPGKDVSTKGNEYPVLTNSSSFSSTSSRRINRV